MSILRSSLPNERDRESIPFLRHLMLYVPGALIPVILALVSAIIYTRIFSVELYGQFALVTACTTLAVALSTQWVKQGINRFVPGATYEELLTWKRAIVVALVLLILFLVVVGVIVGFIGAFRFGGSWGQWFWAGWASSVASGVFGSLVVIQQARFRPLRFTTLQVGDSLARFTLGLFLVFAVFRHPVSILWGGTIAEALILPIVWSASAMPKIRSVGSHGSEGFAYVRKLWSYGLPMVGWTLSETVLGVGDRFVIQIFRGSEEVGIFAANYGLTTGAIGLIVSPVLLAAHPILMESWSKGSKEECAKWIGKVVEWFIVGGAMVVALMAVFSYDVASIFLGSSFRSGHSIMAPALAGVVIWQLGLYTHKPLEFANQTALMFKMSLMVAAINIVANVILVSGFGYAGAPYARLISSALYVVITAYLGQKILKWRMRMVRTLVGICIIVIGAFCSASLRDLISAHLGYWPGLGSAAVTMILFMVSTGWAAMPKFKKTTSE